MKLIILASLFGLTTVTLSAQMMAEHAAITHKTLVDNDAILATEINFPPGVRTDMHTHPAHFVYALTSGKLVVTWENGESETIELRAGDSAYFEPEGPHTSINPGTDPVKILLVEFKDKPYVPSKMSK